MRAAGTAVALLVAGATVAGAAVAVTATGDGRVAGVDVTPWSDPRPSDPCRALADLVEVLDLDSVGDQAALRARGAALADALLVGGARTEGPEPGGERAEGGADAAVAGAADPGSAGAVLAGRRILAVLDGSGATVSDLVEVLGPVAESCRAPLPATVPAA